MNLSSGQSSVLINQILSRLFNAFGHDQFCGFIISKLCNILPRLSLTFIFADVVCSVGAFLVFS